MQATLNPETLKYYRINYYGHGRKTLTQKQLGEKIGVDARTINRWENGKHLRTTDKKLEKIAKEFRIERALLTRPIEDKPEEKPWGVVPTHRLDLQVERTTKTALELVCSRFNVDQKTVVDLAPLLFLITAESSLLARKQKARACWGLVEEIDSTAPPHLKGYVYGGFENVSISEDGSIAERDIFADKVEDLNFWEDWQCPYTSHLQDLADEFNEYSISGSYDSDTGVLSLSGTATVAQYQAALRSVTYRSTSDDPTATSDTRTITFGTETSTVTSTIDLTAVERVNAITVIDNTITLSGDDDTEISGATVTIDNGFTDGDVLGFTYRKGDAVADITPNSRAAPSYEIALDTFRELTGIDDSTERGLNLRRLIMNRYIVLDEVRNKRQELTEDAFQKWLDVAFDEAKEKHSEDKREDFRRQVEMLTAEERRELLKSLGVDVENSEDK